RRDQLVVHVAGDDQGHAQAHALDLVDGEVEVLVTPVAPRRLAEVLAPDIVRLHRQSGRAVVGEDHDVAVLRAPCRVDDLLCRLRMRPYVVEFGVDGRTAETLPTPGERTPTDD